MPFQLFTFDQITFRHVLILHKKIPSAVKAAMQPPGPHGYRDTRANRLSGIKKRPGHGGPPALRFNASTLPQKRGCCQEIFPPLPHLTLTGPNDHLLVQGRGRPPSRSSILGLITRSFFRRISLRPPYRLINALQNPLLHLGACQIRRPAPTPSSLTHKNIAPLTVH